jgi:hypothetical protein
MVQIRASVQENQPRIYADRAIQTQGGQTLEIFRIRY